MAGAGSGALPPLFAGAGAAGLSAAAAVAEARSAVDAFPVGGGEDHAAALRDVAARTARAHAVAFSGKSGSGKSSLINALAGASLGDPAAYAARVLADEAEAGAPPPIVEVLTPSQHDPFAVAAPPLRPSDVVPGADVESWLAADGCWGPSRVLAVRTVGGRLQARVDSYLDDKPGVLANDADAATWYTVVMDDAPATGAPNELRMRTMRTMRVAADDDDDDDVAAAVSEDEISRYTLLPEGATGHTTEVAEQILVSGQRIRLTEYYEPLAVVLRAVKRLRRYVDAANTGGNDEAAALAALNDDASGGGGGEDSDDEDGELDLVFPQSRDATLARAALGLPAGCDLTLLQPADVPAALPARVAALLGRARRFTPGVERDEDAAEMQARHVAEVRRALAERTRCVWDPATGAARSGNPHAGLIARVVVELPGCGAVAGARALIDTRGAEVGAASTAAASLDAAAALVMLVDSRTDQSGLRSAAKASGVLRALAMAELRAHVHGAQADGPPAVRCAVVLLGDKPGASDVDVTAALRPGGGAAPETTPAMTALRDWEARAMQLHRQHLSDDVCAVLRKKLSPAKARELANAAVAKVRFLVVYPRLALGHAPTGMPPPRSTADAARLRRTCRLSDLAEFIEGAGSAAAARAGAMAEAAAALRSYTASLRTQLALTAAPPAEVERLRAAAATVAPPAAAVRARIDAAVAQLDDVLPEQMTDMMASLRAQCTASEFGRQIALAVCVKPEAVVAKPPTQFSPALAAAAEPFIRELLRRGSCELNELYALMAAPIFDWVDFGAPSMPPVLALGWVDAALAGAPPSADAGLLAALFNTVVEGVYGAAETAFQQQQAALHGATAAQLRALLSAGRRALAADVARALKRRMGNLNATCFWAGPDAAARDAAREATCGVLERARKGKQAAQTTNSAHKSSSGTKVGVCERHVGFVADRAAAAFVESATAALRLNANKLREDLHALVSQHCGRLSGLSAAAVAALAQRQLWPALEAHAAADALAASLEQQAGGGGAAAMAALPARLLPFGCMADLVPQLARFLTAPATLDTYLNMTPAVRSNMTRTALRCAAEAPAAAAITRQLAARTQSDFQAVAAAVVGSMAHLAHAFGANAQLTPPSELLAFLAERANAPPDVARDAPLEEGTWQAPEMYSLLGVAKEAATLANSGAWPPIGDTLEACAPAARQWLRHVTKLYNERALWRRSLALDALMAEQHRTARAEGTPLALKPLPQRTALRDWLGARVVKKFGGVPFEGFAVYVSFGASSQQEGYLRVMYEDDDEEDMSLAELKPLLRPPELPRAGAQPPRLASEACEQWHPRSEGEVFTLVATLQASAGAGPAALTALRDRYAPCPLRPEDGWLVLQGVFVPGIRGLVTEYRYYGGLNADGTPDGLLPTGATVAQLYQAEEEPTKVFTCWPQVASFRGTAAAVTLPRAGGGGSHRMFPSEEEAVRDAMTPRTVTRDGKACPSEAVAEALGDADIGVWKWAYKTRTGGKSAGYQDVLYWPPGLLRRGATPIRSLTGVKAWLVARDPQAPPGQRASGSGSGAGKRARSEAAAAAPTREPSKRARAPVHGYAVDDSDSD